MEHREIPDEHRHEVKGSSTASQGQVLQSNGQGGTFFNTVSPSNLGVQGVGTLYTNGSTWSLQNMEKAYGSVSSPSDSSSVITFPDTNSIPVFEAVVNYEIGTLLNVQYSQEEYGLVVPYTGVYLVSVSGRFSSFPQNSSISISIEGQELVIFINNTSTFSGSLLVSASQGDVMIPSLTPSVAGSYTLEGLSFMVVYQ